MGKLPSFCLARSRIRWYFFMERKRGLPPLKEPEKRQRLSPTGQDSPSSLTLPPFRQLTQENAWNPSQGMVWLPPLGKRFEEPPDHTEDNHTFPLPSIRGASKPVIEHSIPAPHSHHESKKERRRAWGKLQCEWCSSYRREVPCYLKILIKLSISPTVGHQTS